MDFWGEDIPGGMQLAAETAEDCAVLCENNIQCKAFTYIWGGMSSPWLRCLCATARRKRAYLDAFGLSRCARPDPIVVIVLFARARMYVCVYVCVCGPRRLLLEEELCRGHRQPGWPLRHMPVTMCTQIRGCLGCHEHEHGWWRAHRRIVPSVVQSTGSAASSWCSAGRARKQ